MDIRTLEQILRELKWLRANTERRRSALVVSDDPFEIDMGFANAGVSGVGAIAVGYTPVVDERVIALTRGTDTPIVIGVPGSGSGGVGGGGPPTGAAGGVLGGSYPNPSFADDMATQAELDAAVAGVATLPIDESDVTDLVADLAALQPLDSDLTAIAALTTTSIGRSLLAAADAAAIRTIAGAVGVPLAQSDVTDLVTDLAAKQPLDSDLTAIAALTTTSFGRSVLAAADAAALRTLADAQPLDSDLTAIAALTTTSTGRSLLAAADAAALRVIIDAQEDDGQVAKKNANNNFTTAQTVSGLISVTGAGIQADGNITADNDGGDNKISLGTGTILFGAGFGDTTLHRSAANELTASGKVKAGTDASASNDLVRFGQFDAALDAILGAYKPITESFAGPITDTHGSATPQIVLPNGQFSGTQTQATGIRSFPFDPAEYAAPTGYTLKLDLKASLTTNPNTMGTITFTCGMWPVTAVGTGTDTLAYTVSGTAVTGSTSTIVNPGTSQVGVTCESGDFTAPSAGQFIITFGWNDTPDADSRGAAHFQLRYHFV